MSSQAELTILANKFNTLMRNNEIGGFPNDLENELLELFDLIQQEETRLSQAAAALLSRAYLIAIHLLDDKSFENERGRRHKAQNLFDALVSTRAILLNPEEEQARAKLKRIYRTSAFELRVHHSSAKYYFLSFIDGLINSTNKVRAFVFQAPPYSRSRFATQDILEEKIEGFLFIANQPSTAKLLTNFGAASPIYSSNRAEKFEHLAPQLIERYQAFYTEYQEDDLSILAINRLMVALDELANEVVRLQDNQLLSVLAVQAFYASQDYVFDLLLEDNFSLQRAKNLNACLKQAILVMKNPGQRSEIIKLEELVEKSDYKRFHCDKEKTTYAILHILAAAALLGLAIFEAIASHGLSLVVTIWTIVAEGSSLGVGLGQFYYFLTGETRNTLFAESMSKLSRGTRFSVPGYYSDSSERKSLEILYHDPSDEQSREAQQLLASLERLEANIQLQQDSFLSQQAHAVLKNGENFAIELLRENPISIKRTKRLRECFDAANEVLCQPNNLEAINHLVKLVSKGDYEARRIVKRELVIGSLLALASIALYVITITATVLSSGSTAGTILSPIMLSAVAAHKLMHSVRRERTLFSDEAKALAEYAQFAGGAFFGPPPESAEQTIYNDSYETGFLAV